MMGTPRAQKRQSAILSIGIGLACLVYVNLLFQRSTSWHIAYLENMLEAVKMDGEQIKAIAGMFRELEGQTRRYVLGSLAGGVALLIGFLRYRKPLR